jgi:hypothetical protein
MTRPGSSIPDAEQREGLKLDTAEGLAKSPWWAALGKSRCVAFKRGRISQVPEAWGAMPK